LRVRTFRRAHQAGGDFARERCVLAVPGVANAVTAAGAQVGRQPVLVDANFFEQIARVQRIEQAEAEAFVEPRTRDHITQSQHFALMVKSSQNLRGVHDSLDNVAIMIGRIHVFWRRSIKMNKA